MNGMLRGLIHRQGGLSELNRLARQVGVTGYDAHDPASITKAVFDEVARLRRQVGSATESLRVWREKAQDWAEQVSDAQQQIDRYRDEAAEVRAWALSQAGISECEVTDESWRAKVEEAWETLKRDIGAHDTALSECSEVRRPDSANSDLVAARMTACDLGIGWREAGATIRLSQGGVNVDCSRWDVAAVLLGIHHQRAADSEAAPFDGARATLEGMGFEVHSVQTGVRVTARDGSASLTCSDHRLGNVALGAKLHADTVRGHIAKLVEAVGGEPDTAAYDLNALFGEAVEEGVKGRVAWEILNRFVSEHLAPRADDLMLDLTVDESRAELMEMLGALQSKIRSHELIRMEMEAQGLSPLMCVLCGGWVDHDDALHHGLGPQAETGECPPGAGPAHRGCAGLALPSSDQFRRISLNLDELARALDHRVRASAEDVVAFSWGLIQEARTLSRGANAQSNIIDAMAGRAQVEQGADEEYDEYIRRIRIAVTGGTVALKGLADFEDALGIQPLDDETVHQRVSGVLRRIAGMVDAPIWPAGPTLMDGTDDPVVELAREMGMPEYEEDARAWVLARGRIAGRALATHGPEPWPS
ncbi:MAG: hypothetical protein KC766_30385, partial [Myxococcales bacterium]|nr:hypothetical protein [Myxococcales bacterium]